MSACGWISSLVQRMASGRAFLGISGLIRNHPQEFRVTMPMVQGVSDWQRCGCGRRRHVERSYVDCFYSRLSAMVRCRRG